MARPIASLHYHNTETVRTIALGAPYSQDSTGRVWKYALNGGAQADPGKMMVAATTVGANHTNLSFATAPAIGDKQLKVTLGGTAVTADQYRDGWATVNDGTGEGISYPIGEHPAQATTTGDLVLDIMFGEQVTVAGALAESNVDLVKSKYADVIISVTDQADPHVGVFNVLVATTAFGMIQTWGPASVWQDEASAAGASLTVGTGVAGQVEAVDAAGEHTLGQEGPNAGVIAEYQLIYLQIDR